MTYETKFINTSNRDVRIYMNSNGTDEITIPTGESKLQFENTRRNIFVQFKTIKILPVWGEKEIVGVDGNRHYVNQVMDIKIETIKRKGYESPFHSEEFITTFYNSGSEHFRERFGLLFSESVWMPRGIPVQVAMSVNEPLCKFALVEIMEPYAERRPDPRNPGMFIIKRRQKVKMERRKPAEIEKMKKQMRHNRENPEDRI